MQLMREPVDPKQSYLLRALAPHAPAAMTHHNSPAMTYRTAAERLLASLLSPGTAAVSGAAGQFSGSAILMTGNNTQPTAEGDAAHTASLPVRAALVSDLTQLYDTGLRPRYTWMVLPDGRLVLDLMNGAYLWLLPAVCSAGISAGRGGGDSGSSGSSSSNGGDSSSKSSSSIDHGSSGTSSSSENGGSSDYVVPLDAAVAYSTVLELQDGSMHSIPTAPAAAALLSVALCATPEAAHGNSSSSSSRTRTAAAAPPLPLPLPVAVERAERVVAQLVSKRLAFVSRCVCQI